MVGFHLTNFVDHHSRFPGRITDPFYAILASPPAQTPVLYEVVPRPGPIMPSVHPSLTAKPNSALATSAGEMNAMKEKVHDFVQKMSNPGIWPLPGAGPPAGGSGLAAELAEYLFFSNIESK